MKSRFYAYNFGIPLGCAAHRWLNLSVPKKSAPNVERWYGRIMERPAVRTVLTTPIT